MFSQRHVNTFDVPREWIPVYQMVVDIKVSASHKGAPLKVSVAPEQYYTPIWINGTYLDETDYMVHIPTQDISWAKHVLVGFYVQGSDGKWQTVKFDGNPEWNVRERRWRLSKEQTLIKRERKQVNYITKRLDENYQLLQDLMTPDDLPEPEVRIVEKEVIVYPRVLRDAFIGACGLFTLLTFGFSLIMGRM